MDSSAHLIWFFDHFNPYFQAGSVVLCIISACFCFWSVTRHMSTGVLLLAVGGILASIQTLLFCVSAFQEGKPFLAFLPFELRKEAYLYGRFLGLPLTIFSMITVVIIAIENARRRQRPNQAMERTAERR